MTNNGSKPGPTNLNLIDTIQAMAMELHYRIERQEKQLSDHSERLDAIGEKIIKWLLLGAVTYDGDDPRVQQAIGWARKELGEVM